MARPFCAEYQQISYERTKEWKTTTIPTTTVVPAF
jgi:hypothetical protein